MKSKETLRKTILAKRKFIDPDEIAHKSQRILERLRQIKSIFNAPEILTYLAKPEEADTLGLIDWALEKDTTVYVPITTGLTDMQWSRLTNPYALKNGPFGIPIPTEITIVAPPKDAPVIIPCVAFAENGHRIGHGAGFYDRFLAQHQGPKIAIALEVQHVPDFPQEPHDIKMDAIVTESNTYTFTSVIE